MFENWKILICGAGTMGSSMAMVYGLNGFQTVLYDAFPEQLEKSQQMIADNLKTLVALGDIEQAAADSTQKLISYSFDLERASFGVNMAVESIYENVDAKKELFAQLDRFCTADAILASNTSSLNIFEFVEVSNPDRLIISHWFNPPHMMPLVEIVRGPETSDKTANTVRTLMNRLGKNPVVINRCIPGFIVNRISGVTAREFGYMIDQGWCSWEDIDEALINTYGLQLGFEGFLEACDYTGWDTVNRLSELIYPSLCDNDQPMSLAKALVEKGELGIKSGMGLRDYRDKDIPKIHNDRMMNIRKTLKTIRDM